jgi:glutamyl-tRNA reductase
METDKLSRIFNFHVAGVSYKRTNAATRSQFAINNCQYERILNLSRSLNINGLFIISTCNRTEIYGLTNNVSQLIDLLCTETLGDRESLMQCAYIKTGNDAIEHLFNVGAGLDSQILGDYEIIGQIKQAVKTSKAFNCFNVFLDRLINSVLKASKMIKSDTLLSAGTVSVSFAAIQYIKKMASDIPNRKILVVGIGKIGKNTCKNLVDYLKTKNITLINRSEEKALALANELGLQYAPLSELAEQVHMADIILVATNSLDPILLKSDLENRNDKLIIDLSIPYNVEISAQHLPNITLVNVDELSKIKDETLDKRKLEIPKAKGIIVMHVNELIEWYEQRGNLSVLKDVKIKLNELSLKNIFSTINGKKVIPVINNELRIQLIIKDMAAKMRHQNQPGCHYIEAINQFLLRRPNR